jgi:hypothetical protein
MSERETPFALVFGDIARERFPAIAGALEAAGWSSENRDAFVLLEPVALLLRELAPDEVSPDELEAHLRLLYHAYRHWTAGGWVYRIGEEALARAARSDRHSSHLPRQALYLQLPAGRVWRPLGTGEPPEPLDGLFLTETGERGAIAVLAIFGMHRARPGFSAVAVEGRMDDDETAAGELEVAARRADGSAAFAPLLAGAEHTGVYSVASAGELLLLTCRLLPTLPPPSPREAGDERREAPNQETIILI